MSNLLLGFNPTYNGEPALPEVTLPLSCLQQLPLVKRPNLASLVSDFDRLPHDTVIVSTRGVRTERTSYPELANLARRFAQELNNRGITKGARVLLCGENTAEWVAAFFGCVLQGVLPVPLDLGSPHAFLRRVEAEVSPDLILADPAPAPAFSRPLLLLPELRASVTPHPATTFPAIAETDPLQIIFTSGTTGEPKGIVHTHRNVLASLEPIETEVRKYLKYERPFHPIRILHTLPLSHVFGQFMGLWIPALLAAEVHYESRLVSADLVREIKSRRISVICAVPRVLALLQQYSEQTFHDLSARVSRAINIGPAARWWRFRDVHSAFGFKCWAFICGGAALPPELEQFWKRLGFVVVQGYGMTETTALVSLNHPFKAAQGTIGQVLPGREVKLGPDGEVLVRGETISDTVWQNGTLQKREGEWLATGDLAAFDEAGNLRFRSRKKDVIVTAAGLNIYPEDLEAALRQAGARDAAVIETTTAAGPEPLAVLLLSSSTAAADTIARANAQLAEFQQLHRWLIWPEPDFPRTATGKVLKREITAAAAAGQQETSPVEPLALDSLGNVEPLALDSLGRVELQSRLEHRYGITLDDAAVQNIKTSADIAALVNHGPQPAAPPAQHRFPRWPWNPLIRALRTFFLEAIALPLTRFLAAPRLQNALPGIPRGPLFIVANHVTSYDVPLILAALPRPLRTRCAAAMSGEMLLDMRRARNQGNPLLNLLAPIGYLLITALFNVFPLPQKSGFQRSFRHAGEAADHGYSIIVFPEGRRSDDGSIQPFMQGAGLLWRQLGVPALAVRLEGLGQLKKERARWFRSGKIEVKLQAVLPLDVSATPVVLTGVLQRAVSTRLRDNVVETEIS